MRRFLLPFAFALALLALPGRAAATTNLLADGHQFGLGLGGSNFASGITGKAFLGQNLAAQAVVGYWPGAGLDLSADVLWEMPQIVGNDVLGLNWNAGVGAAVVLGSIGMLGVDGVVGASLQLQKIPLELTAELRPMVFFGTGDISGFHLGTGGAIRYYF